MVPVWGTAKVVESRTDVLKTFVPAALMVSTRCIRVVMRPENGTPLVDAAAHWQSPRSIIQMTPLVKTAPHQRTPACLAATFCLRHPI